MMERALVEVHLLFCLIQFFHSVPDSVPFDVNGKWPVESKKDKNSWVHLNTT